MSPTNRNRRRYDAQHLHELLRELGLPQDLADEIPSPSSLDLSTLERTEAFCADWYGHLCMMRERISVQVPMMWGAIYPTDDGPRFSLIAPPPFDDAGRDVDNWSEIEPSVMFDMIGQLLRLATEKLDLGPPTVIVHVSECWTVDAKDVATSWAATEWIRQGKPLADYPLRMSTLNMTAFHPMGLVFVRGTCSDEETGNFAVTDILHKTADAMPDCHAGIVDETMKTAHSIHPLGLLYDHGEGLQ